MSDETPGIGHNVIGGGQLKSFVERIERLYEEKAALTADAREVLSEAKANGFDTKAIREIIKLRKLETAVRQEQEEMLDLYKRVFGL